MQLTPFDKAVLANAPLLQNVPLQVVEQELQAAELRTVADGEVLLVQGGENRSVFFVLSGHFNVWLGEATKYLVTHLPEGECIGELSIIDDRPVSATVTAGESSRLMVIDHTALWRIMHAAPVVALNLLQILSRRVRRGNQVLEESIKAQRESEQSAGSDALTGLHNRRWLQEMFPRQLDRSARQGEAVALIMADIDHFKKLNDTFGHLAGDEVLRRVANTLEAHLRPGDLCARYGGEEIAVLLPNTELAAAVTIAERLVAAVARTSVHLSDGRSLPTVTISMGVAEVCRGHDLAELISNADSALYRAKQLGRNRVAF
jgi:diguanylate cyclase (GGDEF)-like protein